VSTYYVFRCDGTWPGNPEMPCTGKLPVLSRNETAWQYALRHGWRHNEHGDFCPSHVRLLGPEVFPVPENQMQDA
jgi:hypothetical protein